MRAAPAFFLLAPLLLGSCNEAEDISPLDAGGNYTSPAHRENWGQNFGYSAPEYPLCPATANPECQVIEDEGHDLQPIALSGDLVAQRRLIYIFEDPRIIGRPIQVCAWGLVVAAHPENAEAEHDTRKAEASCDAISSVRDRRGAQWLANTIYRRQYGSDLPSHLW